MSVNFVYLYRFESLPCQSKRITVIIFSPFEPKSAKNNGLCYTTETRLAHERVKVLRRNSFGIIISLNTFINEGI